MCTCRQVNGDCCNDSNQNCAAGVPTTCDAKCAITYNAYYTECAQQIAASFSPQQQSQFAELCVPAFNTPLLSRQSSCCSCRSHNLIYGLAGWSRYSTCSSLPVEPLLNVVATAQQCPPGVGPAHQSECPNCWPASVGMSHSLRLTIRFCRHSH